MLEQYAALYEKIGAILQDALPAGWIKAWAWSEMSERDGKIVVYFLDSDRKVSWITPPLRLYDRFRELNNAARRASISPFAVWTSATFVLDANGTFEIDFGYDPIPIDEEVPRRKAWKARYLPR